MSKHNENSFDIKRDEAAEEYENIVAPDDSWGRAYIAYKMGADWARDFIESQRGLKNILAEIDETKKDWADSEKRLHDKYAGALVERDAIKADLESAFEEMEKVKLFHDHIKKRVDWGASFVDWGIVNEGLIALDKTLTSLKSKLGRGE